MSDHDSFIEEVAEEVRRDQLVVFLRRYQWIIAGVFIVLIGGAAANEWFKASARHAAQEAGDALSTALAIEEPDARLTALEPLSASGEATSILAQLHRAGTAVDNEDTTLAMEIYRNLVNDPETPDLYADLARLNLVTLGSTDMDRAERESILDVLISGQGSFRNLAIEQRAVAALADGDEDTAAENFSILLRDSTVSGGLRVRAQQLMQALGREIPEAAEGPEAG